MRARGRVCCSCLRCDRARRQERRRGDQWQRDDQHVRLVLRSARRSNSVTATAQGPLCQHARPLCERNEIPQLSVATSRSRGGSQQPCKQPCRRAASCKGSLHNGRESEFTADTSAEPYGTCATERATQRSPLGTQQGALPYVGPEPRPTAASSRRNEQGRATTGVASANKVEASWAHHTRSTDAAIRAGAVVHDASMRKP